MPIAEGKYIAKLCSAHIPLNRFALIQIVEYKNSIDAYHVLMEGVCSELPSEIFCGWANVCLANPTSEDAKVSRCRLIKIVS